MFNDYAETSVFKLLAHFSLAALTGNYDLIIGLLGPYSKNMKSDLFRTALASEGRA